MKGFATIDLLNGLKKITEDNYTMVKKGCFHLNQNQLTWRPQTNSWNIQEVLAHLNAFAAFYHNHFMEKIAKTKFKNSKEQFIPSPLGKSAWSSLKLGRLNNVKRKFRAPRNYNPTIEKGLINENEVEDFLNSQQQLIDILESAKEVNLRKVKSAMLINRIIRFRLGDALMFVVYHNERHIQQLKNILNHPKFPKKK